MLYQLSFQIGPSGGGNRIRVRIGSYLYYVLHLVRKVPVYRLKSGLNTNIIYDSDIGHQIFFYQTFFQTSYNIKTIL